jgi:hypothetical protein
MSVPNVRANSEFHRFGIKFLGSRRTANPTRILLARVFSDGLLRVARAARIELTHTPHERFNVRNVQLLPPSRRTLSRGCSGVGV